MCSFHIQTTNWRRSLFGVHFLLSTFFYRSLSESLWRVTFLEYAMQHNVSSHICCSSSKCMRWNGVGEIMIEFTKKSHRPFSFSILHSAISIIVSKFQATFSLFFPWHTEEGEKEIFLIFNACPSSSKWISCGVKLNYIWKI